MTEKKLKALDRAWLAGVFEGRIQWPKQGGVLRFESYHETLIKRFHRLLEIGTVREKQPGKGGAVKSPFEWSTTNMDDTREVLLALSPLFSEEGVAKAAQMIARIERNPKWRKDNPEKANSSVIVNAQPVASETPGNTAVGGRNASPLDAKLTLG